MVFAYGLTKQLDSVDQLSDAALLRFEIVFALVFLALLAIRYAYMHLTRPTALPADTPPMMKKLARLGHLAMYLSLAMIAVSGIVIGALYNAGGARATGMELAIALHEASVTATYATIALHVAAALFHRLKGDGIWSAMVPVWKEDRS